MADPKHGEIIRKGRAEWNRWRAENVVRPDLRGVNLSGAILPQMDLRLRGAIVGTRNPTTNETKLILSPDLEPEQITASLSALADFYRSLGGVGFEIEFDSVLVRFNEKAIGHHVR